MNTQYIQRMTDMIDQKTLSALFKDIIEGLARFGCALGGVPYYQDEIQRINTESEQSDN